MPSQERKQRCVGSAKHQAAVKEIREARETAKAAMNKMRAELKKERRGWCQEFCPRVRRHARVFMS